MKRHTVNLEDLKTEFLSKEFGLAYCIRCYSRWSLQMCL